MPTPTFAIRPARLDDVEAIATIWQAGWADAHVGNVPPELVAARDPASFWRRAAERISATMVARNQHEVVGFVTVVDDEIEQLYVAAPYRGRGAAPDLLARAEGRVRAAGHRRAWLAVVAGNLRARWFYERMGWVDEGPFVYFAQGDEGPISVPAHRYAKELG
jgi:GNAT superfamily N-acetyltransferase